jgi:hypothetical protein
MVKKSKRNALDIIMNPFIVMETKMSKMGINKMKYTYYRQPITKMYQPRHTYNTIRHNRMYPKHDPTTAIGGRPLNYGGATTTDPITWNIQGEDMASFRRTHHSENNYNSDICFQCVAPKVYDRIKSITVCPQCGESIHVANRFSVTTSNRLKLNGRERRSHTISHLERYIRQYTENFPTASAEELRLLRVGYDNYHSHSVAIVNSSRTSQIIRNNSLIPSRCLNNVDRLGRRLTGAGIPILKRWEVGAIIAHRTKTDTPSNAYGQKKSTNNQQYIRDAGIKNGIDVVRMFKPTKTQRIQVQRCKKL